jgi:hypothetical protein
VHKLVLETFKSKISCGAAIGPYIQMHRMCSTANKGESLNKARASCTVEVFCICVMIISRISWVDDRTAVRHLPSNESAENVGKYRALSHIQTTNPARDLSICAP